MKKLLMIALLCTASAKAQPVLLNRVVAVVGSESVLDSDVQELSRQIEEQRRQEGYTPDRDARTEAVERLLEQKLLHTQGQIDSVAVDINMVADRSERHLSALVEEAGGIGQLEEKEHMPIFNLRERLRNRYREQAFAQSMQQTVVSKVRVTPGEVERFYKSTPKDSLPLIAEQYIYAQITRSPASLTEARQRTRERLLDMRERIIRGSARFDVLARLYSIDGSAARGGELDPQPLEGFDPTFAGAIEELKPGQLSEVIETQFGYHLVEVLDVKGRQYHVRHIILRPTFAVEELAAPARMLDSLARVIRADSITFEKAAREFSDDALSKMNGGLVTNQAYLSAARATDARYTETRFTRDQFGQGSFQSLDDYNALSKLKPGELSDSFRTEDLMGNQLSKIVKLLRVIPAHTASLEEDYLRLEQLALQTKQEREYRRWLTEHIDSTYVWITPELRALPFDNKHWVKR